MASIINIQLLYKYPIHAGDPQTSLMPSILPEQLKMKADVAEYPNE
ncbi:MAG TPA: hypothetical protein V6D09_22060 [Leptolyngbyaceae cyanobacterium]